MRTIWLGASQYLKPYVDNYQFKMLFFLNIFINACPISKLQLAVAPSNKLLKLSTYMLTNPYLPIIFEIEAPHEVTQTESRFHLYYGRTDKKYERSGMAR